MFDTFTSRYTLRGSLVAETAFRIGVGRATEAIGTDLPVLRDAFGRPFIPGSTFKGLLRSSIESLMRAMVAEWYGACDPVERHGDGQCIRRGELYEENIINFSLKQPVGIGDLRRRAERRENTERSLAIDAGRTVWTRADAFLAEDVERHSCLVCRTFGSPWLASHVQVKDLLLHPSLVDPEVGFALFEIRDGVAIDRDTGTVSGGKLYDYEVVPSGAYFGLEMVLENVQPWQLGLLVLGLAPFERGVTAVGGGRSRGLGAVRLVDTQLTGFDMNNTTGDRLDALLDWIQSEGESATNFWTDTDRRRAWVAALRSKIEEARQRGQEAHHA